MNDSEKKNGNLHARDRVQKFVIDYLERKNEQVDVDQFLRYLRTTLLDGRIALMNQTLLTGARIHLSLAGNGNKIQLTHLLERPYRGEAEVIRKKADPITPEKVSAAQRSAHEYIDQMLRQFNEKQTADSSEY